MGISVTFAGIPAKKLNRLKNGLYNLLGKKTADDVTETNIEDYIKLFLKKRIQETEKSQALSQAEHDFNDNFIDPLK